MATAYSWPRISQPLARAAIVVALGLIVYGNSFRVPFVFDDYQLIDDPAITDPRSLWPALTVRSRPLGYLTFAVNHALGGHSVWGYHAVNLAIHVAASLTLMGIVRRTLESHRLRTVYGDVAGSLSLVVALVWLAHPLQTQSVTYVMQRFECLAGLFYLLALYCFIRGAGSADRAWAWYGLSIGCCALGMWTKETVVTAPLLIAWYDRVFASKSWADLLARRWRFYLALTAVCSALMAPLAVDVFQKLVPQLFPQTASEQELSRISEAKAAGSSAVVVAGISPLDYARTQPAVILWYLRLAAWPRPLCFDYDWPIARAGTGAILPALAVAALLLLTAWCAVRRPAWGFLAGCFFVILLPTSSVVPIKDVAVEHRMYLPLAAIAAAAVVVGYKLLSRAVVSSAFLSNSGTRWPQIVATTAVLLLGALTIARNRDYRDGVALWADVVAKAPLNPRGHFNLGCMLEEQGRLDEAIISYRKAIEIGPNAETFSKLGTALLAGGDLDGGISALRGALALEPDLFDAHCNLGIVLAEQGDRGQAIRHLSAALRIRPDSPEAHFNLGNAELGQDDTSAAIAHYRRALQLNPQFSDAADRLAWILATHPNPRFRDASLAIEFASLACRSTAESEASYLDTLAAAHAAAGDYDRALLAARRGRAIALAQGQQNVAAAIEARINLYAARQPFFSGG